MNFQIMKGNFIEIFINLISHLEHLSTVVDGIDRGNTKLKEFLDNTLKKDFRQICDEVKASLKIIERNFMKCVIFGETSNGKSAILNALLKQVVVPSSKGRTTSCFISVQGCDEDVGYIMDGNEKKDIKVIEKASEFCEEKYDINKLIQVFWPRSRCEILTNDVEIFDSPGVDYSKYNDEWINNYCRDADVFILAVDGCSTLNESEKFVFVRLKEVISIPSIFVLINKWDLVKDAKDKVQNQHYVEVKKFLTDVLELYKEAEISERLFFISALNALNEKEIEEFERFRSVFEQDLSLNAMRTKFKRHYKKGMDVTKKISQFSSVLPAFVHKFQVFGADEMRQMLTKQCKDTILKSHENIVRESGKSIQLESTRLATFIQKALKNKSFVDNSVNFIEKTLIEYVCKIYRNKMNTLLEDLRRIFIECSCIMMTEKQIQEMFSENLMSQTIIDEYEKDIKTNFRNTATEIRNAFQDQNEESTEALLKIREILNKTGTALTVIGTATLKVNPYVSIAFHALGLIAHGANLATYIKGSKVPSEKDINKELCCHFSTIIGLAASRTNENLEEVTINFIGKYVNEQMNMLELLECFDKIKMKNEEIMSKLKKIQEDNSGIFEI